MHSVAARPHPRDVTSDAESSAATSCGVRSVPSAIGYVARELDLGIG
jgi:hypothetical protein